MSVTNNGQFNVSNLNVDKIPVHLGVNVLELRQVLDSRGRASSRSNHCQWGPLATLSLDRWQHNLSKMSPRIEPGVLSNTVASKTMQVKKKNSNDYYYLTIYFQGMRASDGILVQVI